MTHHELIYLLERVASSLQIDYETIAHYTKELHRNLGDKHLDWSLAHMHASLIELIRDLERHKEYLKKDLDAGK